MNVEVEKAKQVLVKVQEEIEAAEMSDELFNKEAEATTVLLKANQMYEKLWVEKVKLSWMKNGDCNSQFFHLSQFHEASPISVHNELLDFVPRILGEEDVEGLESVPGRDKIKKAVWDLDPASLPRPNGFPGSFLRKCWELVEADFCKALMQFFVIGKIPKGINNNFISLIPKVEGASSLDRFRPICMGKFYCKVLSKIMASRLLSLLPSLISKE
ncbi:uncharacterized protein LOC122082088 [Macadamia integrifolia]|uniref:uncharacterized protein LOC122082088 n=1 Tax=Macadamia integrifolia TaxID=60698 RepID=UPI001C4E40DF|nr:uncharacterized protein LOC122082088 [Macadamia integrifolia]